MRSCSVQHCVLFLLALIPTTVLVHAVPSVKVKLNQLATLPCKGKCSGLVKWTVFHNPDEVLAQCDQTSCRSRAGFEISHDEYLQGNLALVIRSVDYSKRTMYTCDCEGKDLCYLRLNIEAVMWSLQIKPGEDLTLDLLVPEPVEVIYNSKDSDSASSGQICRVTEASLHCNHEYKERVSYDHPNLTLGEAQRSDSGLYIIHDMKNNEVIRMYFVSVEEARSTCLLAQQDGSMQTWLIGAIVGLSLLVLIVLALLIWQHQKHKGREHSNKKREDEAGVAQALVQGSTTVRPVLQSFRLLHRRRTEPGGSEKRRRWRSYSETELEGLWTQREKENKGQSAGAGQRQRSDPSSGERQGNAHMPLLAEDDDLHHTSRSYLNVPDFGKWF